MTENKAYLPSSFLLTLMCYLEERQLDAPDLLALLTELKQNTHINNGVFSELLAQVQQLNPVPALGLRIGRMATPQHFGLVGYLLTSCSTLGQALIRYGRLQPLVLTNLKTEVKVQGSVVSHQWCLRGADDDLSYEFSAAAFVNLYQSLISKPVAPVSVGLPIARPADATPYEAILGCSVEFETSALRVDIPAQLMKLTISTRDPYLLKMLDQQASAMMNQVGHDTDDFQAFVKQLQEQLLIAMKDGDTRASAVAAKMGYSLRSFYRKLGDNGHSYRTLLADTRRRQSLRYLLDPALTPAELAMLLGYSEQSAFIRAFKGWMGVTPGEYRRQKWVH